MLTQKMKNQISSWLLVILGLITTTHAHAQQKDPLDDGVLRVLAIGNSFSEDAIENNLYELAKAANKKIVIGNLVIGGAPLSLHAENVGSNKNAYSYRKIDLEGRKTDRKQISILTALEDDAWDYISFQQASPLSGQLDSFFPHLGNLKTYVSGHVKYTNTKYILHQTWAYAQHSTRSVFANYNRSQEQMYQAIMKTTKTIVEDKMYGFTMLIPSGTAIQNMRTTYIEDNLTRDGFHLEYGYGRFTAACTWFEKLFNEDVTRNKFMPEAVSATAAKAAKVAAHAAVLQPYTITKLTQFVKHPNGKPFIGSIQISFGKSVHLKDWNSVNSTEAGYAAKYLRNIAGDDTNVGLLITESFNSINNNGADSVISKNHVIPVVVSRSSYFGNSKEPHDGRLITRSVFALNNLDANKMYTLVFYSGTEVKKDQDNRETQFVVNGENSKTIAVNSTNNKQNLVSVENIKPDKNSAIKIEVSAGPNNNDKTGYYYLNALIIEVE